jgi:hypothetical protein
MRAVVGAIALVVALISTPRTAGATPTAINNEPLTWDARGRLTSFDALLAATWHDDGRLHELTVDGGGAERTERRHYDPIGNPVLIEWRDANGQLVEWERRVYVGSLLVQQRYNSGWWRRFMWNGVDPRPYGIETGCAPDLLGRPFGGAEPGDGCGPVPLSWGDAAVAEAADGGHLAFFARDIRQSVVALVGAGGDVLERYAYGPDGETLVESAVDSCDDDDGDAHGRKTLIRDPAGRAPLVIREWPDGLSLVSREDRRPPSRA